MARIEINDLNVARYVAYVAAGNHCKGGGWHVLQDKLSIGRKLLLNKAKREVVHLTAVSNRLGLEIAALEEEIRSKQIING